MKITLSLQSTFPLHSETHLWLLENYYLCFYLMERDRSIKATAIGVCAFHPQAPRTIGGNK